MWGVSGFGVFYGVDVGNVLYWKWVDMDLCCVGVGGVSVLL